jgi:hypothetical protein
VEDVDGVHVAVGNAEVLAQREHGLPDAAGEDADALAERVQRGDKLARVRQRRRDVLAAERLECAAEGLSSSRRLPYTASSGISPAIARFVSATISALRGPASSSMPSMLESVESQSNTSVP